MHRALLSLCALLGCSDSALTKHNAPPTATILSHADGDPLTRGASVEFRGVVGDPDGSLGSLRAAWLLDGTPLCTELTPTPSGAVTCTASPGSAGVLLLEVVDPGGRAATDRRTLTLTEAPALQAPTVTLSPDPAVTTDDLVASATHPDGGAVTLTWGWFEDGTALSHTGPALPASATTKHRTYTVTVTPSDATGTGPAAEAQRTVDNSPPTLDTLTLSDPTARVGDPVTCTATATDADDDLLTLTYAWSDGTTGAAHTVPTATAGDTLACTATADDGDGGTDTDTATLTVLNTPPSAPIPALTPVSPVGGDALRCTITTESTDDNEDPITHTFAWSRNGTPFTGASHSALESTIDGADVAPLDTWTCTVEASDGTDTVSATATVTVACLPGEDPACPGTTCLDILDAGGSTGDGRYWLDPTGTAPFEAWCDMTTDGGGWMLSHAYAHPAFDSTPLDDSTLPTSPTTGHSHSDLQSLGFSAADHTEVRFYCDTTGHSRVMHFSTTEPDFLTRTWDGTTGYIGTTSLADYTEHTGHSTHLPTSGTTFERTASSGSWTGQQLGVYLYESRHWNLGGSNRWECDDFNGYVGTGENPYATNHRVWVR